MVRGGAEKARAYSGVCRERKTGPGAAYAERLNRKKFWKKKKK